MMFKLIIGLFVIVMFATIYFGVKEIIEISKDE